MKMFMVFKGALEELISNSGVAELPEYAVHKVLFQLKVVGEKICDFNDQNLEETISSLVTALTKGVSMQPNNNLALREVIKVNFT